MGCVFHAVELAKEAERQMIAVGDLKPGNLGGGVSIGEMSMGASK